PPGFSVAATIASVDSLGHTHRATSTPTAGVAVTDPGVTLSLPQGGQVSPTLVYHLSVGATSPVAMSRVVASIDRGQNWVSLAPTATAAAPWEGDVPLTTTPVPPTGTIVSLLIGGYNALESTTVAPPAPQPLLVTARDLTPPAVDWIQPAHDGEI